MYAGNVGGAKTAAKTPKIINRNTEHVQTTPVKTATWQQRGNFGFGKGDGFLQRGLHAMHTDTLYFEVLELNNFISINLLILYRCNYLTLLTPLKE